MSAEEPALRLARAVVFALACLVVSAAGHSFAGGASVGPGGFALGALGAVVLAYALNGRERGPEVVLAATAGAQFGLHELFAVTTPDTVAHLGHQHGRLSVGMTLVHLTVAMVTGWWLHRGESAVWIMLRLWAQGPLPVLRWLFASATAAAAPPRPVAPAPEPERHIEWEIAAAVHRRGPPAPIIAG